MRHYGSRKIKVEKADLIEKIKENKVRHFEEYNKAVIAYKKEALHQLELQVKRVNDGALNAKLSLVIPVNNSENYDKIIEMFEWEVQDIVELDQNEFLEYVQDETEFALTAKMSNMAYVDGDY